MRTRSQIIWLHLHRLVNTTSAKWPTVAVAVRELYEELVPEHARHVSWSDHKDNYERARLDAQTLRRFEFEVKYGLPAELEPAICAALKDLSYASHDELMKELAAQHGLLAARMPDDAKGGQVADLGRLTVEIGEMFAALAPAIADGRIDEQDAPLARRILSEVTDVEQMLITIRQQVHSIMPHHDTVVRKIN